MNPVIATSVCPQTEICDDTPVPQICITACVNTFDAKHSKANIFVSFNRLVPGV